VAVRVSRSANLETFEGACDQNWFKRQQNALDRFLQAPPAPPRTRAADVPCEASEPALRRVVAASERGPVHSLDLASCLIVECAFVGTQGRCTERALLEIHHVVPFAAGGPTVAENLELRCRRHNAYEAAQFFGPLLTREAQAHYSVRAEEVPTDRSPSNSYRPDHLRQGFGGRPIAQPMWKVDLRRILSRRELHRDGQGCCGRNLIDHRWGVLPLADRVGRRLIQERDRPQGLRAPDDALAVEQRFEYYNALHAMGSCSLRIVRTHLDQHK